MSLEIKSLALAAQVGLDIKGLLASLGNLTELTTVNKTSVVNAINELQTNYQTVVDLETANNGIIDDVLITTGNGWSASKIIDALAVAKQDILNGAPAAFDTLAEIAIYLNNNDTSVANLINLLTGTVRFDASQALTNEQQQQTCTNLDIGNKDILIRDVYLIARDINTYITPGYVEPGYVA